jgi:hypothetical protein
MPWETFDGLFSISRNDFAVFLGRCGIGQPIEPCGGELPAGAWVGTVSKIDGQVVAFSSKHFWGYQLPAPEPVMSAVRAQSNENAEPLGAGDAGERSRRVRGPVARRA